MNFVFESRPSDSPFVESIWRTQSEVEGSFISSANTHFGIGDEIRLLDYPVAVGGGHILESIDKTPMKLIETKTFATGVVALHYQPQVAS